MKKTIHQNSIPRVSEENLAAISARPKEIIRFPRLHEITQWTLESDCQELTGILQQGNAVRIGYKPHPNHVEILCNTFQQYRHQISFEFSIGSADSNILSLWEWGAPGFEERLESLRLAKDSGFHTSVLCAPMLDSRVEVLIEKIAPLVTQNIRLELPATAKTLNPARPGDSCLINQGRSLEALFTADRITELYSKYKDYEKIQWGDLISNRLKAGSAIAA